MRAFMKAIGICIPLVLAAHLVSRVCRIELVIVAMDYAIGIFAGAAFGLFSAREGIDPPFVKLITVCAVCGTIVTIPLLALTYEVPEFGFYGILLGPILGGFGGILHRVIERPGKGKEDPAREKRFARRIQELGDDEDSNL